MQATTPASVVVLHVQKLEYSARERACLYPVWGSPAYSGQPRYHIWWARALGNS